MAGHELGDYAHVNMGLHMASVSGCYVSWASLLGAANDNFLLNVPAYFTLLNAHHCGVAECGRVPSRSPMLHHFSPAPGLLSGSTGEKTFSRAEVHSYLWFEPPLDASRWSVDNARELCCPLRSHHVYSHSTAICTVHFIPVAATASCFFFLCHSFTACLYTRSLRVCPH